MTTKPQKPSEFQEDILTSIRDCVNRCLRQSLLKYREQERKPLSITNMKYKEEKDGVFACDVELSNGFLVVGEMLNLYEELKRISVQLVGIHGLSTDHLGLLVVYPLEDPL